jgi:hypothetical protein
VTWEIETVPQPESNGRARYGRPLHLLDIEAVSGIRSGLFDNELEAAKAIAPKYLPIIWAGMNKEERRYYIKSKRKLYEKMLTRLDPSRT